MVEDPEVRWQEFLLRQSHGTADGLGGGYAELWSSDLGGQLRFRLWGSSHGSRKRFVLPPVGLKGFSPTNFVQLNSSSSILSGSYGDAGHSALVQVDYDLDKLEQSAKLLCELPRGFPVLDLCLEQAGQSRNLFWLEGISKDLYCYSFMDHRVRLFASSKVYPRLKTAQSLWVSPLEEGGRIITTSPNRDTDMHSRLAYDQNMSFIDQDDDLVADPSGFG